VTTGNSSDAPPPRYLVERGWRRLVTDEQEWLARPASWGINYLPESVRPRKSTLFNHYFYPRYARWILCEPCRPLVASLFSEDGVTLPTWVPATRADFRTWYESSHPTGRCEAWEGLRWAVNYRRGMLTLAELRGRLMAVLFECQRARYRENPVSWRPTEAWDQELALELVGPNPFRPISFDPSWRTEAVVGLARGMYESRDFGPMPVLADALEDAGCADADVLAHCRGPGPHVRGCWVVDLVLGKE
jgi:hypothetical protein